MNYSAVYACGEPLDYFLQPRNDEPRLRIADVVLRYNQSPLRFMHGILAVHSLN